MPESLLLQMHFFADLMFDDLYDFVESHGDQAQKNNVQDHQVELKHLRPVNDQVTESSSGSKKFADDHPDERQADIDLHGA